MKVKRKDLRKGLAQLPINYPAPTVESELDYDAEKERVENFCKRLAHNEVEIRDQMLNELPRYVREVTARYAKARLLPMPSSSSSSSADASASSSSLVKSKGKNNKSKKRSRSSSSSSITTGTAASEAGLENRQELEMLLMKLCRGLFYCMWHSDKPLVQLECADRIVKLLWCAQSCETVGLFVSCFLRTLSRGWRAIDRYRMDKYLALVRKLIFAIFAWVKTLDAEKNGAADLFEALSTTTEGAASAAAAVPEGPSPRAAVAYVMKAAQDAMDEPLSVGLTMHICDVVFDELCRADLPVELFVQLAVHIPLYAMSKGNYVEKRVLDFFISPIAGGALLAKRQQIVDAANEAAASAASKRKGRNSASAQQQESSAAAAAAIRSAEAETTQIIAAIARECQRMSVARGTVRVVRVMFSEAEFLLRQTLDETMEPESVAVVTGTAMRKRMNREVDEANEMRIRSILEKRDGKQLRRQKLQETRQRQKKSGKDENDDDDDDDDDFGGMEEEDDVKASKKTKKSRVETRKAGKTSSKKHDREENVSEKEGKKANKKSASKASPSTATAATAAAAVAAVKKTLKMSIKDTKDSRSNDRVSVNKKKVPPRNTKRKKHYTLTKADFESDGDE